MTNIDGIHRVFIWFFLLHLRSILSFEKQKAGTKFSSISVLIDMRKLTHFHSQMVHNWYRDLKDTNELAQRIHENNDENLGHWISAPACKWWTNHFNLKKKKKKQEKAGKRENQTVLEPSRGQMLPLWNLKKVWSGKRTRLPAKAAGAVHRKGPVTVILKIAYVWVLTGMRAKATWAPQSQAPATFLKGFILRKPTRFSCVTGRQMGKNK